MIINGLLKLDDEPRLWGGEDIKNATAAGRKLYACQGLKTIAGYVASRHPYALDYLRSAPVIACSPKLGPGKAGWQTGKTAANDKAAKMLWAAIEAKVEKGAPLREVMDAAAVAYPMRKLDANALNRGRTGLVGILASMPPEVLGRVIPASSSSQRAWLGLMGSFIGLHGARSFTLMGADPRLAWAATEFGRAADSQAKSAREIDVSSLVDFMARSQQFNLDWGLKRALEEMRRWHGRTTMIGRLMRLKAEHGLNEDDVVDEVKGTIKPIGGYDFVPLRTVMDFVTESVELDHCVWTYAPHAAEGLCHVFGIRDAQGARIATLELNPVMRPVQLRGPHNHRPADDVITAALEFGKWMAAAEGMRRTPGPAELADRWLREPPRHMNARCATWPTVVAETTPVGPPAIEVEDKSVRTGRVAPGETIWPGQAIVIGDDGFARAAGPNPDADIVQGLRGRNGRIIIDDPRADEVRDDG